MEISRRGFVAAVAAFAVRPDLEAPVRRVTVLRGGAWREEPRGLRAVKKGERFRIHHRPDEGEGWALEATADEDGRRGLDKDGAPCGEIWYLESTAVWA